LRAIAAIRSWINDQLASAADSIDEPDRVKIDGPGEQDVPIARGCSHHCGERNDDVGFSDAPRHQAFIPHVSNYELEILVGGEMKQMSLSIQQMIDGGDMESGVQQALAQNRAEIARATGDKNTHAHVGSLLKET
jgi:hypothetical protein